MDWLLISPCSSRPNLENIIRMIPELITCRIVSSNDRPLDCWLTVALTTIGTPLSGGSVRAERLCTLLLVQPTGLTGHRSRWLEPSDTTQWFTRQQDYDVVSSEYRYPVINARQIKLPAPTQANTMVMIGKLHQAGQVARAWRQRPVWLAHFLFGPAWVGAKQCFQHAPYIRANWTSLSLAELM
jgi:hypothetical protein